MDIAEQREELLANVLGEIHIVKSDIRNLRELVQEKINPTQKEFLDDDDLEKLFGITKHRRYKLIREGKLKQYKMSGKNSLSLYKRSEVIEAIESGLLYPKK